MQLPSWTYQPVSPLPPIEEGDEEGEVFKSPPMAACTNPLLARITSASDHIRPCLREPLLDTKMALNRP